MRKNQNAALVSLEMNPVIIQALCLLLSLPLGLALQELHLQHHALISRLFE